MELSATAKVVLGMVGLGRRTGYDIKSTVDKSSRYFWAASYGQIYPELKRLEDAGLLRGEDESQGGRARRAYSLTPAGEAALHDWLASDDELVAEMRDEAMLKLFFAARLDKETALEIVRAKVRQLEQKQAALRSIDPAERPESPDDFPYLVLDYGIAYSEWSAQWFRELEQKLAKRR
jgi:DNA-binding PadR family transcriptional regulator